MARSGEHYMPRPDGDFAAWANHYYDAVEKWYSVQGFDPNELKALKEALSAWNAAFPAHVKAQSAAEGARQAKDAARAALEKEVRPVTNFVQGYPKTTNADRAEMGITVRDTSPSPAPAPTSRPLALVESPARLTHQLRLVDESTPTRRARPAGVLGAEVWVKLVDADQPAPTDPAALTFLTMTTKPSFRAEFKAGEGGKTAVYMARWVNTRGEKGPWSEITTATVAA
ncbi:MAG: hypothetical protein ACK55O_15715 [Phycisphaerales bacterium]